MRKFCFTAGVLAVLLTGILAACQNNPSGPIAISPTAEPFIRVSGFIEAEKVNVVSEVSALIVSLDMEEGQAVTAGQTVVRLDDTLLQAQKMQAQAVLAAAQAALDQVKAGPRPSAVAAAEADLARAQAGWLGATRAVTDTRAIVYRPPGMAAQITQTETQIKLAEQAVEQAESAISDADTWHKLYAEGSSERKMADQRLAAAQAELAAAQAQLKGAQDYLAALKNVQKYPVDLIVNMHTAESQVKVAAVAVTMTQALVASAKAPATPEEIALAEADVNTAAASLALIDAQLTKYTLTAPLAGIVTQKPAQAGEVARPGAPLLVVSDLNQLTLLVYVPETRIGQVTPGQVVQVNVDAYPGEVFMGTVRHIASQAEFTPSNVQTQSGRAKLVFAVKIRLPNADGRLKPGMPADAEFVE